MNENHDPDELPGQLSALGDELQRRPRPDARIEGLLGAGPPIADAGGATSATEVFPPPVADPTPKRRTAWIAVAAALALLAGVGLAAYATGADEPLVPATAAEGEESADKAEQPAGDDSADDDGAPDIEPEADADDAHAWLECVTEQLGSMFEDGAKSRADGLLRIDECGEPPADGWFPFGEWPELEMLPDGLSLPSLGDWSSFDELCTSDSTDASLDVECAWPACPDDADCPFPPECEPGAAADVEAPCFAFDFGFGIEIDPEGFGFSVPFGGEGSFFFDPEMLPDTFPDLPDDFEFPRDLPELDDWFETFPWAEEFEGLFGPPEPTDA